MRKYKKIKYVEQVCVSITCDACQTIFEEQDDDEVQAFHCIDFYGGNSSVFGDDSHVKVDICQYCFKKMLKNQNVDLNKCISYVKKS